MKGEGKAAFLRESKQRVQRPPKGRGLSGQTELVTSQLTLSLARKLGQASDSPCIPFSHLQNGNNRVYFTGRITHHHKHEVRSCTKSRLRKMAATVIRYKSDGKPRSRRCG